MCRSGRRNEIQQVERRGGCGAAVFAPAAERERREKQKNTGERRGWESHPHINYRELSAAPQSLPEEATEVILGSNNYSASSNTSI